MLSFLFGSTLTLLFTAAPVPGGEWPQWRGPNGNGLSPERDWDPSALDEPKILWHTNVGMGHASMVVRAGHVYTLGNYEVGDRNWEDVVICLDAETGEEVWAHFYPCAEGEDPGPCASPLLAGNRLYTLSREGHFFCFDAESGEILWQHQLVEEGLVGEEAGYFAPSPIACGDVVVLNMNRSGLAFDRLSGEVAWNSAPGQENFASPVPATWGGRTGLLLQGMDTLRLVAPETGEVLASLAGGSIPDPIVNGDRMIAINSRGVAYYDVSGKEPTRLWQKRDGEPAFANFVEIGEHLYGFVSTGGEDEFQCRALATGEVRWRKEELTNGAVIGAGDKLIVIDRRGRLLVVDSDPAAYRVLSSTQGIELFEAIGNSPGRRREHACWTDPALADGRLWVRSTYGELVCFDMR